MICSATGHERTPESLIQIYDVKKVVIKTQSCSHAPLHKPNQSECNASLGLESSAKLGLVYDSESQINVL